MSLLHIALELLAMAAVGVIGYFIGKSKAKIPTYVIGFTGKQVNDIARAAIFYGSTKDMRFIDDLRQTSAVNVVIVYGQTMGKDDFQVTVLNLA